MTTPLPSSLGPLQVIPPGLLGFFQLKSAGVLPSLLSYEVQPSLEMRDWYFQARQLDEVAQFGQAPTSIAITTGTGSGPQGFGLTGGPAKVPAGQYWYVTEAQASVSVPAADSFRGAIFTNNPLGTNVLIRGPDFQDTVTARNRVDHVRSDHPFWLGPGDTFGIMLYDIVSVAGLTFFFKLRFTPLPI
jgi:hypothetical protein